MARVLIHHGLANRRWPDHWQRHLANSLRQQGHLVSYAQFPNPEKPTLEEWQAMLHAEAELLVEAGDQAGELIFVGHSLGCLNFLWAASESALPTRFSRALLVAPADPTLLPDLDIERLNVEKPDFSARIGAFVDEVTLVASDKDMWLPRGIRETFGKQLGVEPVVIEGANHLSRADGWGYWQGVIDWVNDPTADLTVRG
jgi:predicted alpha/beta hydrolase family esterase